MLELQDQDSESHSKTPHKSLLSEQQITKQRRSIGTNAVSRMLPCEKKRGVLPSDESVAGSAAGAARRRRRRMRACAAGNVAMRVWWVILKLHILSFVHSPHLNFLIWLGSHLGPRLELVITHYSCFL